MVLHASHTSHTSHTSRAPSHVALSPGCLVEDRGGPGPDAHCIPKVGGHALLPRACRVDDGAVQMTCPGCSDEMSFIASVRASSPPSAVRRPPSSWAPHRFPRLPVTISDTNHQVTQPRSGEYRIHLWVPERGMRGQQRVLEGVSLDARRRPRLGRGRAA